MFNAQDNLLPAATADLAIPQISWSDPLRRGIWPKPWVFWAIVFHVALFILRPWEILFPELGQMRFELFATAAIGGFVLLKRGPMIRFHWQNITMLCLFAAVLLSGRNAWDPSLSEEEIVEFFGFVLIFFFIQKAVRTQYQSLFIIASYVVLTTVYTGKSIWEFLFNGAADYMMGVWRLSGLDHTYGHPNTFATSMLVSLPFAIYFYRIRHKFTERWPRFWQRLFPWVLRAHIALCLVGIVLTQSRSGVVGLVFFAGLIVLRQRGLTKKLKWGVLVLVLIGMGFAVSPQSTKNRLRTLWDPSIEARTNQGGATKSAEGRWEGFVAGVEIYRRFPVTGVGIGNFIDYRFLNVDQVKLAAHNLPGELLGELGTVGTAAFLAFCLAHFSVLRKLRKLGNEYLQLADDPIFIWLYAALFDALLLLAFSGLSAHVLMQYQWYFFAGFAVTCLHFVRGEVRVVREFIQQQNEYREPEVFAEAAPIPVTSGA